jgi:hypothetical protein
MSDRLEFGKWAIGFDNWDRPTTVVIRKERDGTFTAVGDMHDGGAECMRDLIAEVERLRGVVKAIADDCPGLNHHGDGPCPHCAPWTFARANYTTATRPADEGFFRKVPGSENAK